MAVKKEDKATQDLENLRATVLAVQNLIRQLHNAVRTSSITNPPLPATAIAADAPNALDLAHDAAKLIKAHSTKISLLIINAPFTPTAISTVLRELAAGPLPCIVSAAELCFPQRYTHEMSKELRWRAEEVLTQFRALLDEVPLNGNILNDDARNGTGSHSRSGAKGSLASTGVLWRACDELMGLKEMGIAGLMVKKVLQYHDTLKDALEELQAWGEEEAGAYDDDEEADDEDPDDDDAGVRSEDDEHELPDFAQQTVDDIFGNQGTIPHDDPDKLRPRLDTCVRQLRLVTLMYQAAVKRRLKSVPSLPLPNSTQDQAGIPDLIPLLDEVLAILKKIPNITDELAGAFYDLNTIEIDRRMRQLFTAGIAAAELLINNWRGGQDEFSGWMKRFQEQMRRGISAV